MNELTPGHLDKILEFVESNPTAEKSFEELLEDLAGKDPELSETITHLLEQTDDVEKWFSDLAYEMNHAMAAKPIFKEGDALGVYRIKAMLGRGGMAQVFLAERSDGEFEQQVAVKVLQEHLFADKQSVFFQREKEILASLNHPNIARIFDAGIIPPGNPYFIMEYIEGEPVDQYVKNHSLSKDKRLELFLDICNAVSFAHQNLIIHKDLKPQNIYIDEQGYTKLLDFGIADSVHQSDGKSNEPQFATPRFASPEILNKEPIRTTSDIYQLGLILFTIMTGQHPFDLDSGASAGNKASGEGKLDKAFANAGLPVELEAIIRKMLRENPKERYDSVKEIINEIVNYQHQKPVSAYSESTSYLVKTFFKRHRIAARISAGFLGVLITLSVFYTNSLQKQRNKARQNAEIAQTEAARARATVDYLKNIFNQANPYNEDNNTTSVDSLLHIAYRNLQDDMGKQSDIRADIYLTMADIFRSTGKYLESHEAANKALRILQDSSPDSNQFAKAYYQIASTYIESDYKVDSAMYYLHKAFRIDSADISTENVRLTFEYDLLGRIYGIKGDYDKAVQYYTLALNRTEKRHSQASIIYKAGIKAMLGELMLRKSEFRKAEEYLQSALQVHKERLGVLNGYTINDMEKLADAYHMMDRGKEARKYIHKAIRLRKELYGEKSIKLENPYRLASLVHKSLGHYDTAIDFANMALEVCMNNYGPNHIATARRLNTVGIANIAAGQLDVALESFSRALDIKQTNYPDAAVSINIGKYNVAQTLMKMRQSVKAEAILKEVLPFEKENYGEGHATLAITMGILGQTLIDQNKLNEAKQLMSSAAEIIDAKYDSLHERRAEHLLIKSELYFKMKAYKKASELAKRGMFIYREKFSQNNWHFAFAKALYGLSRYLDASQSSSLKEYRQGLQAMKSRLPRYRYYYHKLQELSKDASADTPLLAGDPA